MPLQSQILVQLSHGIDYKEDNNEIQIIYQHVCGSFRFTAGKKLSLQRKLQQKAAFCFPNSGDVEKWVTILAAMMEISY